MREKAKPNRTTPGRPAAVPSPAPPVPVWSPPRWTRRAVPAAAALGFLAVNLGLWQWSRAREQSFAAGTPIPAAAPPGAELRAARVPAADPGFLGVVLSGETVSLEPKAEGRVVQILVKCGAHVTRGTPIAQLERAGREQDLGSARAAFDDAARRFARRAAVAQGPDPAVTAEELDAARSQLAQERARLASATAALDETQVVAPFDATVVELYLAPGALAGPGRPVARLTSKGELRVRFAMPEAGARPLVPGTPVDVKIGSLALEVKGIVTGVNPEVDVASQMIYAVARLQAAPDVAPRLTTGLVARISATPGAQLVTVSVDRADVPPLAPGLAETTGEPAAGSAPPAPGGSVATDAPSDPARPRSRRGRGASAVMPRW